MRTETPREIRKAARKSLAWVAVMAGVSEPTARVHELDPERGVRDEYKRAALVRVYARLAADNAAAMSRAA